MPRLICPLCPYERTSKLNFNLTDFLKHIKLFHSHQSGFSITCGLHGCLRTFKNFRSFRNHVYDYHGGDSGLTNHEDREASDNPDDAIVDNHYDCDGVNDDEDDEDDETRTDSVGGRDLQRSAALFLMHLKEKHLITQTALQGVIEGVTGLMQGHLDSLRSQVFQQLSLAGVSGSIMNSLNPIFLDDGVHGRPFAGLETHHQQVKFYRHQFNLVEPVRISLGERHVWRGSGCKRRCVSKKDEMFYVPILDTLQALLHNDHILEEISNGHQTGSEILEDFCDGKVYSSHPLFSLHSDALQIFFYFDDLELCNPLGSKRKVHKISIFYFTLGNIHPKFRSKLADIQLVAIAKHKHLSTYGMDTVLKPFIEDLKKLENGFSFTVQNHPRVFYGTLAAVSADNLGSLALGGFKESCSAYRCCRHCMATKESMRVKFTEDLFELRSKASHIQHCDEIESGSATASMDYGVNRNSALNDLKYFHVCEGGLLPDIMHDLLEGALQYEVKIMLKEMIYDDKYFTLATLNSRLTNTELGYMEAKDRPTSIDSKNLTSSGHTLSQAAAQMWLLGRMLPLVIGDLVPEEDERWANFLKIMDIVDILFSPRITDDEAPYLAVLISDHHEQFRHLYPAWSIIPKMHFMVHMPRLMLQYGPLVRHWTMRYEAKHAYFKTLAQSMGNFINIPYSLAMRHQQLQCYQNSSVQELSQLSVGPGCASVPAGLEEELGCPVVSAFEAKWVVVDGIEYKREAGIVYSVTDDLPKILKIEVIYVINGSTVLFKESHISNITNLLSTFHCTYEHPDVFGVKVL